MHVEQGRPRADMAVPAAARSPMVKRLFLWLVLSILVLFVLPLALHAAVWATRDHPTSWARADWGPSGLLPPAHAVPEARVHVLSARTGGLKGAVAVHSWIVTLKPGAARYDRYDVVGWGTPVRRNAYPADGRWYSNEPVVHYTARGAEAERLIPEIERAVAAYRWRNRGDYTIFPGPNSNTFVASVIRAVPGFEATLPPTALGRDFPADGRWFTPPRNGHGLRMSLGGYAGVVLGGMEGVEFNFLGTVFGFDPATLTLKLPGWGALPLAGGTKPDPAAGAPQNS